MKGNKDILKFGYGFKGRFRAAKTMNERRYYFKAANLVRAKRNPVALQSVWDDFERSPLRNWKNQTKNSKQHGYNQKCLRELKLNQEYKKVG